MARKRYQRGALKQEAGNWILRWREDVIDANGNVSRCERQAKVGTLADLPTKRLARRVADEMINQLGINAVDYKPGRIATVSEFWPIYEKQALRQQMKLSVIESYCSSYRCYIQPVLDDYRIDEIRGDVPQKLVTFIMGKGLARKTITNALCAVASMLTAARKWKYIASELDWESLYLPPEPAVKQQRFFTMEEAQAIIDAAPEPWNLCFAFMAYLGLRTGEAVGIAWDHLLYFDQEGEEVLTVLQSNWRGNLQDVKSKASRRDEPLPAELVRMIKAYYPKRRESAEGLLFPNLKGKPITSCYLRRDILHPLREKLGIPPGAFHAFRHGTATHMFSKEGGNASPAVVQSTMGHAHLATTMRYTHVIDRERRAAVNRMTEAFLRRGKGPNPPAPAILRGYAGKAPAKLLRIK